MNEIQIDEKTRLRLINLTKEISDRQMTIQIICETYLNACGGEGEYRLIPNLSAMVKVEKEDAQKTEKREREE